MRRVPLLVTAAAALLAAGCSSSRERTRPDAPEAPDAATTVRDVRDAVTLARSMVRAPRGRFVATAGAFSTQAAHGRASAIAPSTARAPLRIEVAGTKGAWIAITDDDAAPSPATLVDGALAYRDARPDVDVVIEPLADGVEEVRVHHAATARIEVRERVELGPAIASLRARERRLEAVDAHGVVRLATAPVFAVDARGRRRELAVRVEGDGARRAIVLALDAHDLVAPIAIDPAWSAAAPMKTPRCGFPLVQLGDGRVLAQGGFDGGSASPAAEIYDPAMNTWTSLPDDQLRYYGTASLLPDGRVLLVGGTSGGNNDPATASYFDPTDDTFTPAPAPPVTGGLGGQVALVLPGGKILIAGGSANTALSQASIFDPATKAWTSAAPLAHPRDHAAGVVLADGRVLVAGGQDDTGASLSSAELFDPKTGAWSAAGDLGLARSQASAVGLPGGDVLVVGGHAGNCPLTAERFDAKTNAFVGPLYRKAKNADQQFAVGLGNGLVLVGGGGDCLNALTTAELYDPALDKWSLADPMSAARESAAAIRLADGRVLVAGGSGQSNGADVFSSIEIFTPQVSQNGTACKAGAECASGFCADGVCCDAKCDAPCLSCNAAGSVGVCTPRPSNTTCGAVACSGATNTGLGHCSGADATCVPGSAVACPGFLVCNDATSCKSRCFASADCTSGGCDVASGQCLLPDGGLPTAAGQRCTTSAECASGHCVDGVCCDSACADPCHHCALPGSIGTCTLEPSGTDLRHDCGAGQSCIATCDGQGACVGNAQGSQCAPARCTDATHAAGAAICPATGAACPIDAVTISDCRSYACDPLSGACKTSCQSSDDCAPNVTCDVATGQCVEPTPTNAPGGCSTGAPREGVFATLALGIAATAIAGRRRRRR